MKGEEGRGWRDGGGLKASCLQRPESGHPGFRQWPGVAVQAQATGWDGGGGVDSMFKTISPSQAIICTILALSGSQLGQRLGGGASWCSWPVHSGPCSQTKGTLARPCVGLS